MFCGKTWGRKSEHNPPPPQQTREHQAQTEGGVQSTWNEGVRNTFKSYDKTVTAKSQCFLGQSIYPQNFWKKNRHRSRDSSCTLVAGRWAKPSARRWRKGGTCKRMASTTDLQQLAGLEFTTQYNYYLRKKKEKHVQILRWGKFQNLKTCCEWNLNFNHTHSCFINQIAIKWLETVSCLCGAQAHLC